VALDFPAAGSALWALYDRGGPRPEYVLPMLYAESGFDPSVQNRGGAAQYGINQASEAAIAQYGPTDVQTYLTWPASQQISTVVSGMLLHWVALYGPLRSGTRVEQANMLPATLPTARALSDVVAQSPSPFYVGNQALDQGSKGAITVGDIAAFVSRAAQSQAVQDAISHTYALRPSESTREPVYGEDFSGASNGFWTSVALLAAAAAFVYWYSRA
jgi:hypothetical protein